MLQGGGVIFNLFFVAAILLNAFIYKINILIVLCVYIVLLAICYLIVPYRGRDFSPMELLNIFSTRDLVDSMYKEKEFNILLLFINAIWIGGLSLAISTTIQQYILNTPSLPEQQIGGFVKKLLKNTM